MSATRYGWRRLSSAKWDDAWLERLAFLGPGRAMIVEFPGARSVRVEAHGLTEAEARSLVEQFGGTAKPMKYDAPTAEPVRAPLRIRKALVVAGAEADLPAGPRAAAGLLIPAGMAFGTGDHATTATCLRLLVDAVAKLGAEPWEALDLGTGTGILGMAAARLGARSVLATDFDPHAVRTAKANAKLNRLRNVRVLRQDVRKWVPERRWPIVMANLFSGLLCEVAPRLAQALAPGGTLIFSGVLRTQEAEVVSAMAAARLAPHSIKRKGKWVAGTMIHAD